MTYISPIEEAKICWAQLQLRKWREERIRKGGKGARYKNGGKKRSGTRKTTFSILDPVKQIPLRILQNQK